MIAANFAMFAFAVAILTVSLFGQTVVGQQNGETFRSTQMTNKHALLFDDQLHKQASNINTTNANNDNSIKVQYVNEINGLPVLVQFTYVGPPKILPIATADSYPEGATINLICTVSGGQRKGLMLNWEKDGQELNDELLRFSSNDYGVSIEKTGTDISILRIANATHDNSGRYTCKAKNPIGEDSTSAQLVINGEFCCPFTRIHSALCTSRSNCSSTLHHIQPVSRPSNTVELKWNKLPADTEVGLDKDVSIECDATSQPQPTIQWTRLPSSSTGKSSNGM
jgi:hypothetical protein